MAKAFKDVPLRDPPPLDDDGLAAVPSATSNFGLGAVKHVRGMPGLPTNAVLNVLQIVGRHRSCRVVVLSGAQWIAALTAAFIGACDRYVALLYSPLLVRVPFARTTVPYLYLTHSRSFFPFCLAFHFPQLILFVYSDAMAVGTYSTPGAVDALRIAASVVASTLEPPMLESVGGVHSVQWTRNHPRVLVIEGLRRELLAMKRRNSERANRGGVAASAVGAAVRGSTRTAERRTRTFQDPRSGALRQSLALFEIAILMNDAALHVKKTSNAEETEKFIAVLKQRCGFAAPIAAAPVRVAAAVRSYGVEASEAAAAPPPRKRARKSKNSSSGVSASDAVGGAARHGGTISSMHLDDDGDDDDEDESQPTIDLTFADESQQSLEREEEEEVMTMEESQTGFTESQGIDLTGDSQQM